MVRVFIDHSSKHAEQAKCTLEWPSAQGFDSALFSFGNHSGIGSRLSRTRFIVMF